MAFTPIVENAEAVVIGAQLATAESAELQTSRTYKINFDSLRIGGTVDGKEAIAQAIMCILQTERFAFLIYSWGYGFESNALIGADENVIKTEIGRYLTEALTEDDRIDSIENVEVEIIDKQTAAVSFTAVSVFGEIPITTEVSI